jgi:allophanate hydrolase
MLADPIQLNSRLGTYTNFVNLLDLCGLAVPASIHGDGTPFGITLLAPHGHDARLASLGRRFHADTALTLGALGLPQPPLVSLPTSIAVDEIELAVVGAHLSGMPLNHELTDIGARMIEPTATARDYRLYALTGSNPPKPGMIRVEADRGTAIQVEIWAVPASAFGRFVASIPPPMSIGTVRLADGRVVKGFLAEAVAVERSRDISNFGGWRAYLAQANSA